MAKPLTTADGAIKYDPRQGFRVYWNKVVDPEGTYLCSADYNNNAGQLWYTVTFKDPIPQKYEGSKMFQSKKNLNFSSYFRLEYNQNPEETVTRCKSHKDCPPMMHCQVGGICHDRCKDRCGKNANCRLSRVNEFPECYCPTGFTGDATNECFNVSRYFRFFFHHQQSNK